MLANPDFVQQIKKGSSTQSSDCLSALSPSHALQGAALTVSILSWQVTDMKEGHEYRTALLLMEKILPRNTCVLLARVGSHGSPLDQSEASEVPYLDSGRSWFFLSLWALATQTQVGFYSEGRRKSCWGGDGSQILISSPDCSVIWLHLSNSPDYLPQCPVASNSICWGKFLFPSNRWLLFLHFST